MSKYLKVWLSGWGYAIWFVWIGLAFGFATFPVGLLVSICSNYSHVDWIAQYGGIITGIFTVLYLPYGIGIFGAVAQHGQKGETYQSTIDRVYGSGPVKDRDLESPPSHKSLPVDSSSRDAASPRL